MTAFEVMWLRDHMEDLIMSLGFTEGYFPDGWQPRTALESDISDKIDAIGYRLQEHENRIADNHSGEYMG